MIRDDQALIAKVEGKGLVIISGCGHAGIINTINYAKKLGGTEKIYAVLGGFHLSGELNEHAIEPTVKALQDVDPDYIVPCHCTGWKATTTIIQRMPQKLYRPASELGLSFRSLVVVVVVLLEVLKRRLQSKN